MRIPVTWRDHIDDEGNISAEWLNRVHEVVDYAYDIGMYVIINVHHDGGGDPQFGAWICNAATDYDGTPARYTRLWEQIAERFQDYDEHLIFESMNEVGFDNLSSTEAYKTLNNLNQAFVDLIYVPQAGKTHRAIFLLRDTGQIFRKLAAICIRCSKTPQNAVLFRFTIILHGSSVQQI